ncbi:MULTISPECIES: LptF/LptG family permease [unclassified Carboxylicivirga]|uniref:LptF/LptG family permease n=1 Tax=Carboxylicivirga TaxID=1628153 RepID=UPI003D353B0F
MKKLDLYILKKFLGTFFFAILLIISISVVFDVTEKIDNFFEHGAPLDAIIFDYYKNFVPYFANLFTPLFVFIAVIFFTSKMAYQTEIIAILSSGVSFRRMMFPYFLGAAIIGIFSFLLGGYVIPPANQTRIQFENVYVKNRPSKGLDKIHMQIEPGVFVYMDKYRTYSGNGEHFSIEKYDGKTMVSKLSSRYARYDTTSGRWQLKNYIQRDFIDGIQQRISSGAKMDTLIPNVTPKDFKEERKYFEMMTNTELNDYIDEQRARGVGNLEEFLIEKYKRVAAPFSAFILTLIGVSLASRKVRGGMGLHIGVGIALSFGYILFMTISTTFAINGSMNPILAVWLPNIVFTAVGIFLYIRAPK